jgi:hypothetical protein
MKKLFLLLIFGIEIIFGQNYFSGKNAWLYDSVLSCDKFLGRKTGTPEAVKSAEWIASKFKEWNLNPRDDNKSYIQNFPLLFTEEINEPRIIIKNAQRGELILKEGDDFVLFTNSGSGKFESDVVFLGFGYSVPEWGWDDYKGIDVKGKIVLMVDGSPENTKYDWSERNDRNNRFKTASEKGAAGFLMVRGSANVVIKGAAIVEENYDPKLVGAYILDFVMREFFKGTGKTFDEVRENLKRNPQSFNTGKKVFIDVQMKKADNGKGENVIGIIPGSDEQLKDEYVVFGAHMDHNGKSGAGYVYPGADDNGSGTSVVMELARSLKQSGIKFKRSLVFIGFGAEEQGLLGSNYFVKNPTIPKDKIVAMMNFDMVGVGDGGVGISGIETIRKEWNEFFNTLSEEEKKNVQTYRAGLGGSDYTGFKIAGIPALTSWSTGSHKYYHVIEDNYSYVKPEVMDFVGNIFYKWAKFLGEFSKPLYDEYRNEKSLLNSCNLTDLNLSENYYDLEYFRKEEFGKYRLENGIKYVPFKLNNTVSDLSYEKILKKCDELIKTKKYNFSYINFSVNGDESRGSVNGSKLVLMPVIEGIIKDEVLINTLNKVGFNYFRILPGMITAEELNDIIKVNKQSTLELVITGKEDFLNKTDFQGKVIFNISYNDFKNLPLNFSSIIKKYKNLLIIRINTSDFSNDDIEDMIKKTDPDLIHLDVSKILMDNNKKVYKLIRYLKNNNFDDESIRKIFGGNLMKKL